MLNLIILKIRKSVCRTLNNIYVLNMKQDEENENNLSSSQQQSSQQKDKKEVNKKGTNKKNEDNSLASNFCSACSSLYTLFIILYTTCSV